MVMAVKKNDSDRTPPLEHPANETTAVPLVVDLDGSLLRTDSLLESLLLLVKSNPLFLLMLVVWLLRGKAYFKQRVSFYATLDVSSLPYNTDVLDFLQDQYHNKRTLILATGADERVARQIADYIPLFEDVIASDGHHNLTGRGKQQRLVAEFGSDGFDYLGNDTKDFVVWQEARQALVVGTPAFIRSVSDRFPHVAGGFEVEQGGWRQWVRALRLYQWLKNMLVFVPLLASHRFFEASLIVHTAIAFFSFSFCASSVYVLNDLLDLTDDRRHPRKRFRPFASGVLPLEGGLVAAPLLLGISLFIGASLPPYFLLILAIYYSTTLAYSFRLKSVVILDVIILSLLFTERMMAGSAAINIWPSPWLLAHSLFLFISLALVKRYAELVTVRIEHGQRGSARGYLVSDSEVLAAMGIASAFVSALVLVLYITSGSAELFYGRHNIIWLAIPLLLYWLCYIWLIAHRGGMFDDPMIFALKDRVSRYILLSLGLIMVLAI